MSALFLILGVVAAIAGLICSIIILIEAFRESIVKGIFCIICGLYGLYYAVFDFEHDNKWLIVLGALGGGTIAGGFLRLAGVE